jgi:Ca2+-binding EF-hand superfamily protein
MPVMAGDAEPDHRRTAMQTKILKRSLLTLAATALITGSAAAQPAPGQPEAGERGHGSWLLKRYDADGSGDISLQEFQAGGDTLFARLDADGDGRLSPEELAAAREWHGHPDRRQRDASPAEAERHGRMRAGRFARMDTDGDGYISRAEFEDARMARFSALDANGNSVIDADELPARGQRGPGQRDGRGYGKRDCSRSK